MFNRFSRDVKCDYESLLQTITREGTPDRVHLAELFLDREIQDEIDTRYAVTKALKMDDPDYELKRQIAIQRFLGYDYVVCGVEGAELSYTTTTHDDAHAEGGRQWMEEHRGPIGSWQNFEDYPWPAIDQLSTRNLERLTEILPDYMCIIGGLCASFCENLCWLFGYEQLCYALYDQRNLVQAVFDKVLELEKATSNLMLQFDRAPILWHSDDMGFKTGLMISPDDTREFVLKGHRALTELEKRAGKLNFQHSCGNRTEHLDDLIDDVGIDCIHSFEDTIELITDAKRSYGKRMTLLGGIDVDFLCRSDEAAIRKRVRETLEVCMPGGGYCLGTGNSVANYIPVDNYLVMVDEGRRWN